EDAPVTTITTSTEAEVIAPVSDTPAIRISLRRLAASVGCSIVQLDEETISVFDCGPYALIDNASGDRVWHCGLPLAGILDALHRLARAAPSRRSERRGVDRLRARLEKKEATAGVNR